MKKIAVFVLALLSLTACGVRRILPEAENISSVTVSGGGIQIVIDDERHIAELLQEMGRARDTGCVSTQDRPEGKGVIQVDFAFRQGGVSTLFLYRESDRMILEQPFGNVYEIDKSVLNFLR